jgi:PKD repeat protein
MTEIKYEWDFDGNGTYEVETDTNPISYSYNSPGTYTAKVRITDSYGGLATGDVTVKVYKNSSGEKGSSSDNGNDNGNGRGKKIGHRNK